jgi:hypothetical protein
LFGKRVLLFWFGFCGNALTVQYVVNSSGVLEVAKDPSIEQNPGSEAYDLEADLDLDLHADGLARLIPQCMYCHSIRNEEGEWIKLEDAVDAAGPFSHGTCPDCEPKLYAQLGVDVSK